jgi:hypothetical protein
MAWDSSRPVPWNRLIREWSIYAVIMSVVFLVFFRGSNGLGAVAGVLISGPLYLGFGAAMAKFGYQRTRLKDIRGAEKPTDEPVDSETGPSSDAPRRKPAPTSRTAGGGNRPKSSSRRKR